MIDNKTPDMERAMQGVIPSELIHACAIKAAIRQAGISARREHLALFVASPENASEAFQHPSAYSADVMRNSQIGRNRTDV